MLEAGISAPQEAAVAAAVAAPEQDGVSYCTLSLWMSCARHLDACHKLLSATMAATYLPAAELAVAILHQERAGVLYGLSDSSSSSRDVPAEVRALLDQRWEMVCDVARCFQLMLVQFSQASDPTVFGAAEDVTQQQQALDALLASQELKELLAVVLGLYARQLYVAQRGKSPAASLEATAAAAAAGSGSSRDTRQQRWQQQQDVRLLVPAVHSQLLDQFGMYEDLLAGSSTAGSIARLNITQAALSAFSAVQLIDDGIVLPGQAAQHGSGSSSSSSSGAWPSQELFSAVLQTVVEVQVRPGC
jgi:hypothetical protein